MYPIVKLSQYDTYNQIMTSVNSLKALPSIQNNLFIPPAELQTICVTCQDGINKLSDITTLITKKIIDVNISENNKNIFKILEIEHNKLIEMLIKLCLITDEIVENVRIYNELYPDIIVYCNFNIVNKIKIQTLQINDCIKKIIPLTDVVRDK